MKQRLRAFRLLLALGFQAASWQLVLLFGLGLLSVAASLGVAWGLKLLAEGVVEQRLALVMLAAFAVAGAQVMGRSLRSAGLTSDKW